jgi:hypothetical protein
MRVQAVNKAAQERYATFKTAIALLQDVIDDQVRGLVAKIDDSKIPGEAWSVPTSDEVKALCDRAVGDIEDLAATAKKYEAELISREWRV